MRAYRRIGPKTLEFSGIYAALPELLPKPVFLIPNLVNASQTPPIPNLYISKSVDDDAPFCWEYL